MSIFSWWQKVLVVAKGGFKLKPLSEESIASGTIIVGGGRIEGHALSMSSLAFNLSAQVDRYVVDKTNLLGRYDVRLDWSPGGAGQSLDEDGEPSIFSASRSSSV